MKNRIKRGGFGLSLMLVVCVFFQSCKCEDVYHKLSDEDQGFLFFEKNETFKLKKISTSEILLFTVITKEVQFVENGPNESSFVSFGTCSNESYFERGFYRFTDATNCYNGEFVLSSNGDNGFEFNAYLSGCFGDSDFLFSYQNEFYQTMTIEGVDYSNVYVLNRFPTVIYYSKEKGILKIAENGITKFSIVE